MSEHVRTKRIVSRLARVEGHVGAVKRMVEDGRPCADVLVQIAAVRAALDRAAKELLSDHMEHCILGSRDGRDSRKALGELQDALARFIR